MKAPVDGVCICTAKLSLLMILLRNQTEKKSFFRRSIRYAAVQLCIRRMN